MRKIARSESLTEQAYKEIKSSIVNNRVEPLDYLAEEQIANQLGISRTPIREALKQLAYEGLVELRKGSKARVSKVSPEEAIDYQMLRERLETMAAFLAAEHVVDKDIEALRNISYEQMECIESNDFNQFLELDNEFHSYIAGLARNVKLKEYIENLNNHLQRYIILTNTLGESVKEAVEEHFYIIDALEVKNGKLAEEKMKHHITRVMERIFDKK